MNVAFIKKIFFGKKKPRDDNGVEPAKKSQKKKKKKKLKKSDIQVHTGPDALLPAASQLDALVASGDSYAGIDALSKSMRASGRSDVSQTRSESDDVEEHRKFAPRPAPRLPSQNVTPPLPRMRPEYREDAHQGGLQRSASLPPGQRRYREPRSPRSPRMPRVSRTSSRDPTKRHSLILDDRQNVYEDIHSENESKDDIDTIHLMRKLETDAAFRSRIKGLLLDERGHHPHTHSPGPPGGPTGSPTPDLLYSAPLGAASSSGDDADAGPGREGGMPPRAARRHRRPHTTPAGGQQYHGEGWGGRERRPRPAPRTSGDWTGQRQYSRQLYHEARGMPLWEEDLVPGDDGEYLEPVACQSLTDLVSAAAWGAGDPRPVRSFPVPFTEASFTKVPPRHEKAVSTNGRLLWKLNDFAHKQRLADAGLQVFYYSAPFLSGPEGYRMCARVYLGTGPHARSHMGLDLELTKGDFDYILRKNAFSLEVQFRLVDQGSHKRHIQRKINPVASHSLGGAHLPWDKETTPVQCPDFFHLDLAHARDCVYIREDSIIMYVEVESFSVSDIYM